MTVTVSDPAGGVVEDEFNIAVLSPITGTPDFSVVSGSTHPVVSHPAHNMGGCSGNESPRTVDDVLRGTASAETTKV